MNRKATRIKAFRKEISCDVVLLNDEIQCYSLHVSKRILISITIDNNAPFLSIRQCSV